MRRKLTKNDFLGINRRMNGNLNARKDITGWKKKMTRGEEMKLNRAEGRKGGQEMRGIPASTLIPLAVVAAAALMNWLL